MMTRWRHGTINSSMRPPVRSAARARSTAVIKPRSQTQDG
jgi:hypothetical protein